MNVVKLANAEMASRSTDKPLGGQSENLAFFSFFLKCDRFHAFPTFQRGKRTRSAVTTNDFSDEIPGHRGRSQFQI